MIEDKKHIILPKTEKMPDSRRQLRTFHDDVWKDYIFFHILQFYKKIDSAEVIKLVEKEKEKERAEIEEAIKKLIEKWLKNDEQFDTHGFKVNREPKSENGGFYDLKFEHSDWQGKYFSFECKNLDETSTSIKEYVYNESKQDGGVYRYMIYKYAKNLNCGGTIGFIIKGKTDTIIEKIIKELHQVFDNNAIGELTGKYIIRNSIENNKNTFNSIHLRTKKNNIKKEIFTLHHIMMNFSR